MNFQKLLFLQPKLIVILVILGVASGQHLMSQGKRSRQKSLPPNSVVIRLPPTKIEDSSIRIRNGMLFDALALIGQSPAEAEKTLGKAVEVEQHEITADQLAQPGKHVFDEIRHYKVNGKNFINYTLFGLRVRFLKGKAVSFDLDLPVPQTTAAGALALVGIDVRDKKDFPLSSPTAKFWRDYFNGKRLTVAATIFERPRKLYDLVEVRLYQDEQSDK